MYVPTSDELYFPIVTYVWHMMKISVCLAIWLIWWTNTFVIKIINTPGHVLSPGWPLCKRSGLTLIEVSQHAYSSYQAFSLPFISYHIILATWCNWLDFYWCWIKFCLSLSLNTSSLPGCVRGWISCWLAGLRAKFCFGINKFPLIPRTK